MRVPKFRAWDRRKNIFYYTDNNITVWVGGLECSVNGRDKQICNVPYEDVDKYTGLKDKNGVEDWINDIVKANVGQVTYYRPIYQAESGAYCISLPTIGCASGETGIMICTIPHENVGNVHENPELLETDNDTKR